MGIPVGKLSLYTALAGVQPGLCLPIMLDVGTNNDKILTDPLYIGLRQKRKRGQVYDEFIDEFMSAVVKRYGRDTLVQFEDFGNHNAFKLLDKYRDRYCAFNDDIQGTATTAVAGIMASLKITGKPLSENTYVFQGAGEAAIGIARLLLMAMREYGLSESEALQKIWMVDSKGLIVKNRPSGGVTEQKALFAKDHVPVDTLEQVVKEMKPTCIIGAAAQPGAFTEQILIDMAAFNDRPIIFALSNPTSKTECTAEEAYKFTKGRCVFASGPPFRPVTYENKVFHPGQGNNAYIFPAVALATILCDIRTITDEVFLESAKFLASMVTEKDLEEGRVYPPLSQIREVSTKMTIHLLNIAYKKGLALHYPEPSDKDSFVRAQQYSTEYLSCVPEIYEWPQFCSRI